MRIKIGISLMMALLVVVSSCAVTIVSAVDEEEPTPTGLEVVKEVSEGRGWVNEIYAEVDDIVYFKITITYHATDPDFWVENVVVTDTLPPCLEFDEWETVFGIDFEVEDNIITWDFGEERFYNNSVITIYFSAKVVDFGINVNHVKVTAKQTCGKTISGEDTATVKVYGVKVEKTVWDPDTQEWVEYLDGVIKDVDVRFQIKITYYGEEVMKCMKVEDDILGDYLEFADNVDICYLGEGPFDDPSEEVSEDLKEITWKWGEDKKFNLCDQESIIIEFDANVTDYCYYEECKECCVVENWAYVYLGTCWPCSHYFGCDSASVNCRPHDPVFQKTVLYKDEWVDEGYTYKGEEVQFKIELTYYGNYNLTDIVIIDYLPEDILTYAIDSLSILTLPTTIPVEWGMKVSEDGKVITWDTSAPLNDGETLTIWFKAEVFGSTGDCEECGNNTAEYTAVESCTEYEYNGDAWALVHAGDEINIGIRVNCLNIGRVNAHIKNNGKTLEDVDWTIQVTGGLFKRVASNSNGTIESLPNDASAKISTGWRSLLHKAGRVTITITATPAGGATIEETFKGIVIGRIILVKPLIRFLS